MTPAEARRPHFKTSQRPGLCELTAMFSFLPKEKTSSLPESPGVYCFSQGEKFLYLGKAVNIKERVKNHLSGQNWRDNLFMDRADKIGYWETPSEIEALILEANLIKKFQPEYNVAWRDDKSYFYVAITNERLPRILLIHRSEIKSASFLGEDGSGNFIGPFTDGRALKTSLRLLRKVFPYYTAKKHPLKLCQNCLLKLCPGPDPDPAEYRKNIRNLTAVLLGKKTKILTTLKREMLAVSKKQDFEKAARIRNQIFALEKVFNHAAILNPGQNNVQLRRPPQLYVDWKIAENWIKKFPGAEKEISRIEAYDISNLQGKEATGAMVVFKNGQPDKSQYRKFRIRFNDKPGARAELGTGLAPHRAVQNGSGAGPNDVAMIKEILTRRFSHPEWPYPQLILIDGGVGQLNAALKVKSSASAEAPAGKQNSKLKNIFFAALAKRHNELFLENRKKPLLLKELPRPVFNLILQLRDEAHRFARSYHFFLRKKKVFDQLG